ncbi:hypothetical protein BGZ74_002269 [Mortierella antarctica]|nr:hypothetical protein BGZ74_002269 [Mortierella antarctica]
MADLAFHIPHILNSITDSLSFSDLLNCILVCRQWHDRFIAILWTDVVTFRSKPAAMRDTWTYLDYSRTPPGRQALLSHAYAIRALTCQGSNSLQILRVSSSINLLEINYLMDSVDSKVSDTGLGDLAKLITVNPRLTGVSIENIDLEDDHTREELSRFLDFIDKYSTITSVYLNPGLEFDIDTVKYWRGVWSRLVSRISTPSRIYSLRIQSHTTRSKRALRTRQPWRARESPITVKIEDSDLRRERRDHVGGRWESEHRHPMPRDKHSTTVMESDGHLVLSLPSFISWPEYAQVLRQFPNIQSLVIDSDHTDVGELLGHVPQLFPHLSNMDIHFSHVDQRTADNVMETLPQLSSLSLDLQVPAHQPPSTILSRHYVALTSLTLTTLPMTQLFSIVSACPVLRELAVEQLVIQGSEPEISPRWICPMQKLHLHIVYGVEMGYVVPGEDITLKRVCERRSAERVAPSFMAQVGRMTKLSDLKLMLQWDDRLGAPPFFELSLDPTHGLPQLFGLRQLTSVALLGSRHSIGKGEIQWMRRHWPRLRSLEVPILQEPPYIGTTVMAWRDTYRGQVPDYSQWFPGLKVVVPDHCYSCWYGCWDVFKEDEWEWQRAPSL